jgi:HAMP domain-containing protein
MLDSLVLGFLSASPQPLPNLDDVYNSPGTIGFITTFLVAGIAILLFFDMNRRIRRTKFRQEIRARLASEELSTEVTKPERPEPPKRPSRQANPESDSA